MSILRTIRLRGVGQLLLLLGTLSLVASALADTVRQRTLGVTWKAGAPLVSFSARDLATPEVQTKLQSGLPQTIVTRVYAYAQNTERPVSMSPKICRVVFDLWEGVYRVQVQAAGLRRSEALPSVGAVINRCLSDRAMPIGVASDYTLVRRSPAYFAVIVELNPLSEESMRRIRHWLATPGGSGRFENDTFFGSFVSMFVTRRIGSAERTLAFRSQQVVVP